jgi:hypothetical protein
MERYFDRWLRRRSTVVVVASKYLQDEFKQLGSDAIYIPYAAYLSHEADDPSPFRAPTAVYVGNFFPAYDHDLVLEAARILKDRGKSPRMTMLGMGPDLEKWRAFVREQSMGDSITLPGFVDGGALWRHLRHAHVLLLPIRPTLLNLCRCPSKTYAYAQSRRPIIANGSTSSWRAWALTRDTRCRPARVRGTTKFRRSKGSGTGDLSVITVLPRLSRIGSTRLDCRTTTVQPAMQGPMVESAPSKDTSSDLVSIQLTRKRSSLFCEPSSLGAEV